MPKVLRIRTNKSWALFRADPTDNPLFHLPEWEMRERLATAVSDLPEHERLVLTHNYYEESTMKEIGLILGAYHPGSGKFTLSAVVHLRGPAFCPQDQRQRQGRPKSPGSCH